VCSSDLSDNLGSSLGGGRSIQLSYRNIIFMIFPYDPLILYYPKEKVKIASLFFLVSYEDL